VHVARHTSHADNTIILCFIFAIEGVDKEMDHCLATWDKPKNIHQLFMFFWDGITIAMYL